MEREKDNQRDDGLLQVEVSVTDLCASEKAQVASGLIAI
jgi:hypothetical protein